MSPDHIRPSKPDLIIALAELSKELRTAVNDLAVETIAVHKIMRENRGGGREPEVVAASKHQWEVGQRLNEIWDRARKPILSLGMMSKYGEKLGREFRCLSLRPSALEVLKFVEFLEVFLEADASAPIADLGDKVQAQEPQKRPRGRPSKIPPERKANALEARKRSGNNLRAAKILWDTEEPTKTQRDSVSQILKTHCKKLGVDWPPK